MCARNRRERQGNTDVPSHLPGDGKTAVCTKTEEQITNGCSPDAITLTNGWCSFYESHFCLFSAPDWSGPSDLTRRYISRALQRNLRRRGRSAGENSGGGMGEARLCPFVVSAAVRVFRILTPAPKLPRKWSPRRKGGKMEPETNCGGNPGPEPNPLN